MGQILYGDAMHIREQAKIDAARITQKSGNERRGAESELQRFSANLANRRAMDAAGKNINAVTENIARNLDAGAFGTFMGRVAAAEELGANVAAASAAGFGGSSVQLYNDTMRLNEAMKEEGQQRDLNSDLVGASASRGEMLTEATAGLDNNIYRASLDFTRHVDHKKMGTFAKITTLGLAAGATYFGGPQAGMAVIGMSESRQAAQNGDFGTASQELNGAIQNGIGGFKAYRAGAGKGDVGQPVGKATFRSVERIFNNNIGRK